MTAKVGAIVGATAVGKSEIALEVAEALGAEIVSMDSMQIYRGMDIGTDKPTHKMRERVPHHLLDLKDPAETVTVAEFQRLARDAIDDISARGALPLLVGGSGLYLKAVVDDLRFPPTDAAVRADLEAEAEELGAEALYERLLEADPAAAGRIERGNTRRIVRALEVVQATGRRFSDNSGWDTYESRYDLALAGLTRPRDELYERIAQRVDRMLRSGFEDEVASLRGAGLGRTARAALGYRQFIEAEDGVELDAVEAQIVRATKRFARRQESWFRADPRIRWFDAREPACAEQVESFFVDALALQA